PQKGCGTRSGWDDLVGLRGRPGAQARGTTRPGPQRSISAPTATPGVYTEGGRTAAPTRGRRSRRQDCSRRGRDGAERDLRGRFPRVLVWVPAGTWPARCAGRAGGRDLQPQGELDTSSLSDLTRNRIER